MLKVSRAGHYTRLVRLLVKHGPSLRNGPDAAADESVQDDAEALSRDLEALGPTFIKLGQLLSTRSDLLPQPYLDALARLQDDVAPVPVGDVRRVFREEIGAEVDDVFAQFSAEPLAAASLGQVHRARLRSGREVVVKIQRPGVEATVAEDLEALGDLAQLLDAHTDAGRRYGFEDLLEQFSRALNNELDYQREADNLTRLGQALEGHPLVVVPQPVADMTSRRVITMDEVPGRKVTDMGPMALMDLDGDGLATALFRAYLDQIFVAGFFHADPHPGNVLVTPDGRLGLIDLGMVGYVRPELRSALVKLLLAVDDGRGEETARILADLGHQLDDYDAEHLMREVSAMVSAGAGGAVGQVDVALLLTELTRLCGTSGLRPPPELSMLARALLNLDAVAKTLAPHLDPSQIIRGESRRLVQAQMQSGSGGLLSAMVEAKDFAEAFPGRVARLMEALSSGNFQIKVDAFDETEFLKGLQKLANRVTMGLVIAALVLGAAIISRSYPQVALACFLLAAICGFVLIVSILAADRDVNSRTRRKHRL
ncbi:MAG TPA: AarF/UbiB family protein [Acidimicrobiales bacterium]|nr:AarF/UbiB family protein [Acidimicrobiales bacterium]